MTPFQDLSEYTTADIQSLIDNSVEESIHLDFKAAAALDKSEKKKDEIAKDVSSFANSDGGVIVYGILEKEHCADSLSFVDGNTFTKEWLEQVINSKITKRIVGIQIFPVRFEDKISQTVYVVKIPRSDNVPHMSNDRRYYRRYNFVSVPMEEYEVRDAILRVKKSKLSIVSYYLVEKKGLSKNGKVTYSFGVGIKNTSGQVETVYKVNTSFITSKGIIKVIDFNWDPAKDSINYSVVDSDVVISGVGRSPIFPDEKIDLCRFDIEILSEDVQRFMEETSLRIVLYFTGGKDEVDFSVKSLFAKKD